MAQRRNTERSDSGRSDGIPVGTLIAAAIGWRDVATLQPGDAVLTFGASPQRLVGISRDCVPAEDLPRADWPLCVPQGALDTRDEILILPGQDILIEADCVERSLGTPFALIPAAALDGWRGIGRSRPAADTVVVRLEFAAPQVVYASRAVLLSCPGAQPLWGRIPGKTTPRAPHPDYCRLSLAKARHLIACLMAEDLGAALRARTDGGAASVQDRQNRPALQ